jgi:hypothetical protein
LPPERLSSSQDNYYQFGVFKLHMLWSVAGMVRGYLTPKFTTTEVNETELIQTITYHEYRRIWEGTVIGNFRALFRSSAVGVEKGQENFRSK